MALSDVHACLFSACAMTLRANRKMNGSLSVCCTMRRDVLNVDGFGVFVRRNKVSGFVAMS